MCFAAYDDPYFDTAHYSFIPLLIIFSNISYSFVKKDNVKSNKNKKNYEKAGREVPGSIIGIKSPSVVT